MSPEFSTYLDLVRILAAGLVLLAHTNLRVLSETVPMASGFGHSAVVVFFVLSGYVISYVVSAREQDGRSYTVSRIARLYSVVIPALVLAIVLDGVGRQIDPSTYLGQSPHDRWWLRALATLTLMNEPWGVSITAFSVPFWSVSYEGWYYILFGLFTFWAARGRNVVLAIAVLLCGPKVLLLMPIWLAGVYLHRGRFLLQLNADVATAIFVLSLLALGFYHWIEGPEHFRHLVARVVGAEFQWERMTWSGEFVGDYLVGALVALNFAAFRAARSNLAWLVLPFAKPIRWAASFTFSLYLFHRPLILFYIACLRGDTRSHTFYFTVVALTLVSVYGLGLVTEHRKEWFKQIAEKVVGAIETLFVRAGLVASTGS